MRLLLLKPLFLKKQSNLLKILFEKSFQKNKSLDFIFDLILLLINKGIFLSAKKRVLLVEDTTFVSLTLKTRQITSTKKIIYSF